MTEVLAVEIQSVVDALPASHQIESQDRDLVDNPGDANVRLQDWAILQGFALVKESSQPER